MRRPPPTTHEAIQMCCEVGGLRGCLSTRGVAAARELPPTRSQLLGDEAMLASLPFSVPVDLERHSEAPRSTYRLPWPRQHGDQAPPNDLAVVDITPPHCNRDVPKRQKSPGGFACGLVAALSGRVGGTGVTAAPEARRFHGNPGNRRG